jgi:hypothetical protein
MSVFEQKMEAALAVAAKNNYTLTRLPNGTWRGALYDFTHNLRFNSDVIAALVNRGQARYTRFKDGTQAGIEISTDVTSSYEKYQIT